MERIGGPLRSLLSRMRLDEGMEGWSALELWPEAVGDRVAAHARAVGFRDGTLWVEVSSAAWMTEIGYLRRRIQDDLNRRLGKEVIKEIRLRPAERGGQPSRRESS